MRLLELKLFAGFQLLDAEGKIVSGISRKAKALLAWLALNPNQEYPREKLASILWPDSSEAQARHSLRQALTVLRKVLPVDATLLQATKDWILLDGNHIQVDVQCFNQSLAKADSKSLEDAIQLYRGSLLEGCNPGSDSFDDWLFTYRNNYNALASSAVEKRLALLLTANDVTDDDYEDAIHYATRLIEIDELHEYGYQTLMIAHHKLGNYSVALQSYQMISDKLQQQLAISPSKETQRLYQMILAPHVVVTDPLNASDKTVQALSIKKKRRLSNSNERLLYQVEMAIEGVVKHSIGHSFLIRGQENRTNILVKEMIDQAKERKFIYCHKKVSPDIKEQDILVGLLEVLTIYLTDPQRLKSLQKDTTISLRALSMLQRLVAEQPIMVLLEDIHHSPVDLMVQLAELTSLIGGHAVLVIMVGDLSSNDPLEVIWQSAMIGAPLTTIDI
ncbi:MAG: hypothetical protein KAH03_02390 [Cocleimonas sp.]|nr:hypothetical protein [Cocleimonas sp.]